MLLGEYYCSPEAIINLYCYLQVIIKQESFIGLFVMIEFIKGDTTHKEGKNEVFHIKR